VSDKEYSFGCETKQVHYDSLIEEGVKYTMRIVCSQGFNVIAIVNQVKLNAPLKKLVQELLSIQESLQSAQKEALVWKRKLSKLPALERQYRAKVAEAKLSQTEEGRSIVENLINSVENSVLKLN